MAALLYGLTAGDPKSPNELRVDTGRLSALLVRSCELGSSDGCSAIAGDPSGKRPALEDVERVRRSIEHAISLVAPRCEASAADACFALGRLYGLGSNPDAARARAAKSRGRSLLADACRAGNLGQNGCTGLGEMYLEFQGEVDDLASAEAPLTKACAFRYLQACQGLRQLASFYQGEGGLLPKDEAKAMALFRRACAVWDPCMIVDLRQQLMADRKPLDAPLEDPPVLQR
jgi:hypothetical protein